MLSQLTTQPQLLPQPVYLTEARKYYTEPNYYTTTTAAPVYYTEAPKYYAEPTYYTTSTATPAYYTKVPK
jgi:hypothetical protein